ncbi:MAG TPA: hypothetical protein VFD95_13230 [Usitatibacter sp.]|nr:hypothetical protein [Usitatibacter sp.]
MRRAILVALGIGAVVTSAAAFSIGAGEDSAQLTREQFAAELRAIESQRAANEVRCSRATGFERDFCRIEAQAEESVRIADAEAAYRRTQHSARAAQRARIEARYQVERAKCGVLGGLKRDKCMVKVHASRGRSMLEAATPYEVRF